MTKERREQLSNRLVMNFGFLLAGALVLLYLNSALRSGGTAKEIGYWFSLGAAVIGLIGSVVLFAMGQLKQSKMKNYSAIFLGVFIGSGMIYISKFNWIPGYDNIMAVISVYIAMVVYFIVMAVITAILVRKPSVKDEAEIANALAKKARNKKKKRKK